jgi:glycosyltransferase involved in cell wall biosynthesis
MILPSIAVIIPVFNGERHLATAMQCVLSQTVPPHEIIVVDDGSTDGSAELIRSLAATSPIRITVITQPNAGQSASRNAAAAIASSELLAFLDQDDLWRPTHLERLAEPFSSPDGTSEDDLLGWAYSDFDEIDVAGRTVVRHYMQANGVVGSRQSVVEIIHRDGMIIPSASMLRATAFHDVGGFDPLLRGYEDDDLFLRMFRAGWTSVFVPEAVTSFRVHPDSSSTQSMFRESRVRFFDKVAADLPDDVRLRRYYVSDVLRPRLLTATLVEYSVAISLRRPQEAAGIAESVAELLKGSRLTARQRLGLAILRRPALASFVLRVDRRLPRFLRLPIPSTLTLRR